MENEKIVTIVTAPQDHGFKNFDEARKWAKKNIVGIAQQPEIGEVNISGTAVEKYLSQKAVEKSVSIDVHFSALRVMPRIILNSIVGETHGDKKGDEHIKDIVILYSAINIEDNIYRVKTTVKRYNDPKTRTKAYSYEVTEIEPLDVEHGNEVTHSPNSSNSSISSAKLLQNIEPGNSND